MSELETYQMGMGWQQHAGVAVAGRVDHLSAPLGLQGLRRLVGNLQVGSSRLNEAAFDEVVSQRALLESEVAALRQQVMELSKESQKHVALEASKRRDNEATLKVLLEKERLHHLLYRVCDLAQKKLLDDKEFQTGFERDELCEAFVMSIDIRRSTELMLKARNPKLFAEFILNLCNGLRQIILDHFGVFDKFTGDGVLAFFPDFFSGPDAGYLALSAASECHAFFGEHYRQNRNCFVSVLNDVGLGIGVDFGQAQLVQIGGELTIVGTPVVYSCRMSGANAGATLLNQPAYEVLFDKYSGYGNFQETEIHCKHEGRSAAYSVSLNDKPLEITLPDWIGASQSDLDESTVPMTSAG